MATAAHGPFARAPGVSTAQSGANKYISIPSSRKTQVWADTLVVWFSTESEDKRHRVGSKGKALAPGVMPGGFGEGRDYAPDSREGMAGGGEGLAMLAVQGKGREAS